jgi:ABC-2 type transport system permease protein
MSTHTYTVSDSATMLRRNLRHAVRYPSMTASVVAMPIVMLLLFVYVFGGAIGAGLGGASSGGGYIAYLVPGIILMTLGSGSMPTAVAVRTDMSEGIIARFRTMAIARVSVLTGHVVGSVITTMISTGVVIGVAVLIGFSSPAGPLAWMAVIGVITMVALALTWLAVAIGLASKTPEGASNAVLPVSLLLPFLSSAFLPLNSMPSGVRWFAANQPFTHVIETIRGLLMGTPTGHDAILAVAWCAGIALAGYLWARWLYDRDLAR